MTNPDAPPLDRNGFAMSAIGLAGFMLGCEMLGRDEVPLAVSAGTGPAAIEASPPSLIEFVSSRSIALWLLTRITTSAACPPASRPKLTAPSV